MNEMVWTPDPEKAGQSQINQFRLLVNDKFGLNLENYAQLHRWSVENIPEFWGALWEAMEVIHTGEVECVVDDPAKMPGARWFQGVKMNFAENLLKFRDDRPAILFRCEDRIDRELSYAMLYRLVAKTAFALREAGVERGDRVAGFLPNIPETIIAMLAASSIGAIWSSSSPDFGINGVLDRFSQIEPKVVFAADGYFYKGRRFDSLEKLKGILHRLPSVEKTVIVNFTGEGDLSGISGGILWDDFIRNDKEEIQFEQLPFGHPLYIMYSSGTTGKPKSIVHSAGGTLIQHLKELRLHTDLAREDVVFYFTTCGWMMWNWLVSGLAVGSAVVLYDGNPFYPAPDCLLKMADEYDVTVFGTSAKYISSLESAGVTPLDISAFNKLRAILSTGSPLTEESFDYVYSRWKKDVQLSSISGGTDIISCFALGNPALPVYRGELQCVGLGMDVVSMNDMGQPVIGEKGELVCRQAFPSMPVYFWNDPDGRKYHDAYFSVYPSMWRHGDYILINNHGGVKIFGRSDATLNPGGVRIGTAEIYRVIESLPQVADSVVVGQRTGDDERVILFIKLAEKGRLTDDLKTKIKQLIRKGCSPRHVPALIFQVKDVPYTINGKKVEIAVKKIIHGEDVTNRDALANPQSLDEYAEFRETLNRL